MKSIAPQKMKSIEIDEIENTVFDEIKSTIRLGGFHHTVISYSWIHRFQR